MSLSQSISETSIPSNSDTAHRAQVYTRATPAALSAWLTVERVLYALILLIAAGVRLGWLSIQPLNTVEAGHAWSAWLVTQGVQNSIAPAPDSPLLYSLYTLLFWTLGPADAIARFVPALCGVGVVGLLWYWRTWLGRMVALWAALLLALDPWLTAYSRLADSAMLSIFLAMLTLTGLLQMASRRKEAPLSPQPSPWQTVTAISFGLLLISGPQAWGLLVLLILFGWFCRADDVQAGPRHPLAELLAKPGVWGAVAGAVILGATGWLARPDGLSAISTSLTVWLAQLTGVGAPVHYSLGWLAWRFLIDQPFILIFGLIGLGAYWRNHADGSAYPQGWMRFLAVWVLWGFFLVLLPGRTPLSIAMVSMPLLFFAAYALSLLWQQGREGVAWRENGLLLATVAILLVSFAIWLAAFTNNVLFDAVLARTLLIILVLIFLIILAYTLWLDGRQARLTTGTLLATLLLLWTVSSNWQLNQRFELAYPDGFFSSYTNPDVRRLTAAVQTLSAQRWGDAGELPLQVEMVGKPDPVLGWYLRDMRNLTWVLAPGLVDGQSPPVVITLSEDSAVNQLASSYMGSRYALRDHWLPATLTAGEIPQALANEALGFGARLQERLNTLWSARWRVLSRWLLYREAPSIPPSDEVILWVVAEAGAP